MDEEWVHCYYGLVFSAHGHDWPRAEGEVGVFPPVVVLLLPGGPLQRGVPTVISYSYPKNVTPCQNLPMYIEQAPVYWRPGSFHCPFNTCFKHLSTVT